MSLRAARPLVLVLLSASSCAYRAAGTPIATPLMPLRSEPSGSLVDVAQVRSSLMDRSIRVLVYLPSGYTPTRRYPTLYLLHGLPGTPDVLFHDLDLTAHLDRLIASGAMPPTIIVAPTGGPSPSTDTEWSDSAVDRSQRWGSFLADELVPWVDRSFSTCTDRDDRAVGGLSMGAFGAANLALKHRGLFGAVSSWSGYFTANTPSVEGATGSPGWRRDSPSVYVPSMRPSLETKQVRISFYVGDLDRFASSNRAFDRQLTRLGVPHRFRVLHGRHDWTLWRGQLDAELSWAGRGFTCRGPARSS
jgi:enterochelin esterase-like enzyme